MESKDLTALGLTDEVAQKVLAVHTQELEKQKNTINTLTTERDGYKTQLDTANSKLSGYDPEWKTKADEAKRLADEKVSNLQYEYAVKDASSSLKFSSESAKRAFVLDLTAKKLPVQDGKLLGFDDYVKEYQKSDPGAFQSEETPPAFSTGTSGKPQQPNSANEKANAALRALFGKEK